MELSKALKQLKAMEDKGETMRLAAESWDNDFQRLVSIILSARTRDEVTIVVAEKLFQKYPTAEKLAKAPLNSVAEIIRPVNFYKNKTKSIINCAKELVDLYNGSVPHDIEKLVELSGVGRKTANVFIVEVGQQGIGVDTHVFYISKYLGWASGRNQETTENELKTLFPEKYWSEINRTLVRFGKTHTSRKEKNALLDEIKKIK